MSDKNCGIYKITSPSGRIYIGQSINIKRRFTGYMRDGAPEQPFLENSFKKYSKENHILEIIELCDEEDLNCRERYWQDFYDVLNNGLNCVLQNCGEERMILSEKTLLKKREASLGSRNGMYGRVGQLNPNYNRQYSEEERRILSEKMKGRYVGDKNPFYGKHHSDQTLKILSDKAKEKVGDKNGFFGKTHTDEYKAKSSIRMKEKYKNNPEMLYQMKEKRSIGYYYTPKGVFITSRDVATANNITKSTAEKRCRFNSDKIVGNNYQVEEEFRGDRTWREHGWYFISKEEYQLKNNRGN